MIRFSLFGVPVEIHPFFWVICALLGGVLNADSSQELIGVCLFILAAFVSILVHEFGHALTGRKLGGGYASIALTSFGGLATHHGGSFTRHRQFLMVAAGPGAGFALLLALIALLALFFGAPDAIALAGRLLFRAPLAIRGDGMLEFFAARPYVLELTGHFLWINFWWGVINLLPVMPLDGGRIVDLYVSPQRRVYQIGLLTAGAMAAYSFLSLGSLYMALLFGYLAWRNYQNMKAITWQ